MGSTSSNGQTTGPTQHDYTGWKLADRYEFIRVLGAGGTGTVYLARDLLLNRQVAVKTILPALADNSEVRRRIDLEWRLHAAIGVHPNIVTLYDKLEEDGRIYLVMEYFQGKVLADIITGKQNDSSIGLTVDAAVSLVRQILQGIACIHEHGILHRDIKISNILVQQSSKGKKTAKLMDFGIARLEESSEALTRLTQLDSSGPGTPVYMAPERIDPRKFGASSPATDLYSVGVILYQLVSDGPPFRGSITEIFNGHLSEPVDLSRLREDVSPGLRDTITKALAKEPKNRFTDAESFAAALTPETGLQEHHLTNGRQEDDLTLTAIESPAKPEIESTLLAPEPRIIEKQLPEPGKTNRYLTVLLVAAICLGVFFVTARLFFSTKGNFPLSPEKMTTTGDVHPDIAGDPGAENPVTSPAQDGDELNTTAMEMLQTTRAKVQTATTESNLETMLEQNKTITGDSDWQVIESSAQKIDR